MLEKEFAEQNSKAEESPPKEGESKALDEAMQTSPSKAEKVEEILSEVNAMRSDKRPLHEPKGSYFPTDSLETDENARKVRTNLFWNSEKRFQNPPLLLDDLKELGMCGDLSEDHGFVTLSFKDAQRLVTHMRMSEIILNERIQNKSKVKLENLKSQINASNGTNVSALLEQLEKVKATLAQKHSFHSVGAFCDEPVTDIEGIIFFETLLLARAVDWLATLSIDPDSEVRRGTLSVFSELKAAYSTQKSLHELYFHQFDEKKLLEKRVRGAMSDVKERLCKVAVAPAQSAIAKRQNIDTELQSVFTLVEEMLTIAKQSYSASLTASHMGHLAFELNVTIVQLRRRIDELQKEVRSWVLRSSQDSTAAMILSEENVVLAKANGELAEKMHQLNSRQRKQTEILNRLLTTTDFGLPTTVLQEALPNSQTLLELLDLPGIYSRLIGELREPIANKKGVLSILAPTTFATRNDLVDSIERQLRRSIDPDLNVANAYLNVAQTRSLEVERRGLTVYGEKRIPKKGVESLFHCEPSWLRRNLPPHLKAPIPIASERTEGLTEDLQNRGSVVFVDRFFDAKGRQIQDMQLARDPLPATVLLTNAMNTSVELSELLSRGDIPRFLDQELLERKPPKKPLEVQPQPSSSSVKIEKRHGVNPKSEAYDPDDFDSVQFDSGKETNRGEKRKETRDDTPSPSLTLAVGLGPMPNGEVLHPFSPQDEKWDDLWLERDGNAHFTVNAKRLIKKQASEPDKEAAREVCTFFMHMKKGVRSFQHRVEWKNPSSRVKTVLEKLPQTGPAYVASASVRKQSKQQRRSSAGIGRDLNEALPGLAVEWNLESEKSWVWNDNQEGAANNDPDLLDRLLRLKSYLPDKYDVLAAGKKIVPVDVLASAYKSFLGRNTPAPARITSKGGKGKGKGKYGASSNAQRSSWLFPKPEITDYDLLMLPRPDSVNQEDESYVIQVNQHKVRVTRENWATLRFNTRTMSPEYFPSSYLSPVPTTSMEEEDMSKATFPRSTITGTVEDLRKLLLVPLLSKTNKISQEVYRALSFDTASEALRPDDKATAPKRITTFMRLCELYVPCEFDEYNSAVAMLDSDVDAELCNAKIALESVREHELPSIVKAQSEATSVLLQVLYFLQQGHVLFLMGDYKTRVLEAYGSDAFATKAKAKKLGKDGLARQILNINPTPRSPGVVVDMSQDDEEAAGDTNEEGLDSHYQDRDGEGEQANTHVSSTPQQEQRQLSTETSTPPESSEAAGFSSDNSPRNETGDNDELSRAEGK